MTGTPVGNKGVAIERLDVSAYTVPTDFPESDGTYSWDKRRSAAPAWLCASPERASEKGGSDQ
jgi:hypothetical protein